MSTNAGADPKKQKKKLIIVLERACLETAKVGKDYVLLDCDNHKNFLLKHKRNPADYRPDILHQARRTGARSQRAPPVHECPLTRTPRPRCAPSGSGSACSQS